MFGQSSWGAFTIGVGLLFIVASNIAAPDGQMSYPMLVGGIVIACAGAAACLRKNRRM